MKADVIISELSRLRHQYGNLDVIILHGDWQLEDGIYYRPDKRMKNVDDEMLSEIYGNDAPCFVIAWENE